VDTTETTNPRAAERPGDPTFCDRCGEALAGADHDGCVAARRLEPPRYCGACQRRMIVQITPTGWTATCSAHGALAGRNA
jgi:hypothetical protein